jgi:hypothetical protein
MLTSFGVLDEVFGAKNIFDFSNKQINIRHENGVNTFNEGPTDGTYHGVFSINSGMCGFMSRPVSVSTIAGAKINVMSYDEIME